jgi:hypothetical protein
LSAASSLCDCFNLSQRHAARSARGEPRGSSGGSRSVRAPLGLGPGHVPRVLTPCAGSLGPLPSSTTTSLEAESRATGAQPKQSNVSPPSTHLHGTREARASVCGCIRTNPACLCVCGASSRAPNPHPACCRLPCRLCVRRWRWEEEEVSETLPHHARELPELDMNTENEFAAGDNIRCAPRGVCARPRLCAAC